MDLQKTEDQVQTHELCCIHLCGWTDMGWDDGQPCLLPVNFLQKTEIINKKFDNGVSLEGFNCKK
jgi:hypothetical protein